MFFECNQMCPPPVPTLKLLLHEAAKNSVLIIACDKNNLSMLSVC